MCVCVCVCVQISLVRERQLRAPIPKMSRSIDLTYILYVTSIFSQFCFESRILVLTVPVTRHCPYFSSIFSSVPSPSADLILTC